MKKRYKVGAAAGAMALATVPLSGCHRLPHEVCAQYVYPAYPAYDVVVDFASWEKDPFNQYICAGRYVPQNAGLLWCVLEFQDPETGKVALRAVFFNECRR